MYYSLPVLQNPFRHSPLTGQLVMLNAFRSEWRGSRIW